MEKNDYKKKEPILEMVKMTFINIIDSYKYIVSQQKLNINVIYCNHMFHSILKSTFPTPSTFPS